MTTTIEKTESQFLYPIIPLSSHSSILSFPTTSVETSLAPSSSSSAHDSTTSSSCCYQTLIKYSYDEYKKSNEMNHSNHLVDAKSFFAKAYGKKDMFSKEIKIEKYTPRPVSVNLEETLLQVSHDTSTTLSSPPVVKKSTTLTLFGGLDDDVDDKTTTPASLPPQSSSGFSGFDSFDSFSSPPPKPQNSAFVFDAFETPSGSSKPSGFFDSFDAPSTTVATSSAFSGFDAFDSSFTSSVNAFPLVKECSVTHSLTCFEELLCLYKNSNIDKFQLTGALQYQFSLVSTESSFTPEIGTNLVTNIQIHDNTRKLVEVLPQSSTISVKPAAIGNMIQASLPWEDKFLKEQSSINLIKFLVVPSYRPEYMRTRMNISHREVPEQSQNYLVIAIQLMLNKNYPNITYENIQVMCSLTSLSDITGEVKTRPNGLYTPQSKVVTWRCGNQSAGKQGLFQMEASVSLQQIPSPLPTSLPIIVKALMNDTPIVADCSFSLDQINFMKDGNNSTTFKVNSTSSTLPVSYKSKVEYRFL